jgi:hypothetical protein
MNRGCAGTPLWEVEFYAFNFSPGADTSKEPNEKALIDPLNGLKLLVAKGPSEPFRLTPQQQQYMHGSRWVSPDQDCARLWRRRRHDQRASALNGSVPAREWKAA